MREIIRAIWYLGETEAQSLIAPRQSVIKPGAGSFLMSPVCPKPGLPGLGSSLSSRGKLQIFSKKKGLHLARTGTKKEWLGWTCVCSRLPSSQHLEM